MAHPEMEMFKRQKELTDRQKETVKNLRLKQKEFMETPEEESEAVFYDSCEKTKAEVKKQYDEYVSYLNGFEVYESGTSGITPGGNLDFSRMTFHGVVGTLMKYPSKQNVEACKQAARGNLIERLKAIDIIYAEYVLFRQEAEKERAMKLKYDLLTDYHGLKLSLLDKGEKSNIKLMKEEINKDRTSLNNDLQQLEGYRFRDTDTYRATVLALRSDESKLAVMTRDLVSRDQVS